MPHLPRAGRFETQVRAVLVLVVLFLAALDLTNVILVSRARDTAERAERERAKARGREVALTLGADTLVGAPAGGRASAIDPGRLSRLSMRFDLAEISILDPTGKVVASSVSPPADSSHLADLDAADRAALSAGRAVAAGMTPRSGGESARIEAFVPVLDGTGHLGAVVEVAQAVPDLGETHAWFRRIVAVQTAGIVLIGIVALFFGRFVSRPYRQMARIAGEVGLAPRGDAGPAEPDDLAAAFRAVADKLREQESAFDQLGREAGGLSDLIRFAGGPAADMATGVVVVDKDGRIAAANRAAESLLGTAPGDARGADLGALGEGFSALRDLLRGCLDASRSVSREVLEIRAEGGRSTHVGVTISPVGATPGGASGALMLMTDLTEIRQVQEQVRLRESLAAVGHLSAGIAHEFRNALGTILGYAKMLEKSADPRVHGPAREILREIGVVRAQIDQFLQYARPPEPQRAPVDVTALLRSCAATSPPGITVEVLGEFGTIVGDEGLLRGAFGNLIQNAADIGQESGRPIAVRIVGRRAGRFLQIEVEDDGPGIPADKRAQIFVPFFTTRARGTGLGLALVQCTVVDLGGSIEVGEGPRGGASFRMRLPAAGVAREMPV